ncbi:MAG: hypothetical protein Q9165_002366 [Trypethelium subeluteriae]
MDKIKDLANKAKGATGGSSSGAAQGGQQEDYADKGLDSVENKFGVDSAKYRSTNEKVVSLVLIYSADLVLRARWS